MKVALKIEGKRNKEFRNFINFACEVGHPNEANKIKLYATFGDIIGAELLGITVDTYHKNANKNSNTISFERIRWQIFLQSYDALLLKDNAVNNENYNTINETFKSFKKYLKPKVDINELSSKSKSENDYLKFSNNNFIQSFNSSKWFCYTRYQKSISEVEIGRMLIDLKNLMKT